MTWVRKDDAAPLHTKFLRLSDGAYRLWDHGLAYCNRAVTDGVIAKDLVPSLNHHGRWSPKQIAAFVAELLDFKAPHTAGLWTDEGDCFRVHDYDHHQAEAMSERVSRKRDAERERKRLERARRDGVTPGVTPGQKRDKSRESNADTSVPSRPVPSRPDQSATHSGAGEASPVEGEAPHQPKPAWLVSMEGPDTLTRSCLVAFDVGYASAIPGGRPLGITGRAADLGTLVADAQGMGDPVEIFRSAGAEVARRVVASRKTDFKITHPWRVFTTAPIGTWLGAAESAAASSSLDELRTTVDKLRSEFTAQSRLAESVPFLERAAVEETAERIRAALVAAQGRLRTAEAQQ